MNRFPKISVCIALVRAASSSTRSVGLSATIVADEREVARSLLDQLDDRRFSERQAAFLKLCDPRWDIDAWLDEQSRTPDPNRAALAQWIRRLRSIPGTMDERLEMMGDYQSLASGDLSVVSKYIDNRKLGALVDLLELVPESARHDMLRYQSAENPFDEAISAAWRDGNERVIPRLLNAILPKHPIRVGLNGRWQELGMPSEWRVDEPGDVPEVHIAILEREGRIDEALSVAERHGMIKEYESLLIRHHRWDAWMALDPLRRETATTGWGDVQRVLLLECLGRHDEAMVYYELRKSDKSKNNSYNQQKALMAMLVGDTEAFEKLVKTEAPNAWSDYLFTHSDLSRFFEMEGLSDLTIASVDKWFDKWDGAAINKPVRLQSLFHRLGLNELEEHLYRRIRRHIKTDKNEPSLAEWDGALTEWAKYGLDERRWDTIAELCAQREKDRPGTDVMLSQRGMQSAQDEPRAVTLDTLFFKNFPAISSAARPLYETLRARYPNTDARSRIAIVEDIHQGRMPKGWTEKEWMSVLRDIIHATMKDPGTLEPMLVDLADALDSLGLSEQALALLKDHADSYAAQLRVPRVASKLGRVEDAARLSLQLMDRHRDDVNSHLQASQSLADARQFDRWLELQKQSLSRLDLWEWIERYFQTMRRTTRMEPQPEILFILESLRRHAPSTWHELWFGDAYTQYGARIQSDWYHRSIDEHPERIPELRNLAIQIMMEEIRVRARAQFPNQGVGGATGMQDVDWALWSMQYERVFAACFWNAVSEGDRDLADRLIRSAHRIYPEQINTLIDVVPLVRQRFGEETLRDWFELYAGPLRSHLERYPNDTLVANNTAWLAAKCSMDLDMASEWALRVVEQRPTDTYLDTLAEVEFVRGDIAKAIEISERCRSMKPRDPHHVRQLARFRKVARESAKPTE